MAEAPANIHGITAAPPLGTEGLDALTARLTAARGMAHIAPAWLDFRHAVLSAQHAALEGEEAPMPALTIPTPIGGPILALDALAFAPAALTALWQALVAATRALGQPSAALDAIDGAVADEPALLEELTRAAIAPDTTDLEALAARFEAPLQAVSFLGRTLAAPFLARATRLVSPSRIEAAGKPTSACPFCGSPASLAVLSRAGDGKRHLCCGLCGASWSFPRIRCPACDNEDQDRLGFLKVDHEAPAWVETCDACKAAIKTVDERRLPAGATVVPVVEDILTLHLDLLARREGYTPGPDWVAGG